MRGCGLLGGCSVVSIFYGLLFAPERLAGSLSLSFLWYVCKGVAPPGLLVLCDLVGSWTCPTLGFFFFFLLRYRTHLWSAPRNRDGR